MPPADPIAAVTHADPYPYYSRLLAGRPVRRDEALGLRVVAGAEAVRAALGDPALRVRPAGEPVPAALAGSAAGTIFANHVRMNDGARHARLRRAVAGALAAADPAHVARVAESWAAALWHASRARPDGDLMRDVAFPLPVHVVAALLGLAEPTLSPVARLMADFVACLSPASPPGRIAAGKAAAEELAALVATAAAHARGDDLLAALVAGAASEGFDAVAIATANGIGLLAQSFEATAGLIGNAWLALSRNPALATRLAGEPRLVAPFLEEVLRCDPPIHNTRRFAAAETAIGGETIRPGEAVLLVLAAANRDPALNRDPAAFAIDRRAVRHLTFGQATHECPGAAVARAIAAAAVRQWLAAPPPPGSLPTVPAYRPSANARVPAALPVAGHAMEACP